MVFKNESPREGMLGAPIPERFLLCWVKLCMWGMESGLEQQREEQVGWAQRPVLPQLHWGVRGRVPHPSV